MSTNEQAQTTPDGGGNVDPRIEDADRSSGGLISARTLTVIIILATLAGAGLLLAATGSKSADYDGLATAPVRRGDLTVSVTQGGTLRAMESLEIESEVEGNNQILELVPEGTTITQEDVENEKVLVRLDASELKDQKTRQEISVANAEASYTQAEENYAIQVNQNKSNINTAELNLKFAGMELERYLGAELAAEVRQQETFDFTTLRPAAWYVVRAALEDPAPAKSVREAPAESTPLVAEEGIEAETSGVSDDLEELLGDAYDSNVRPPDVPMGGVARQTLRDLTAQAQLASQELTRTQNTLNWTIKLEANDYVSEDQLKADELAARRKRVQRDAAVEELRLFIRYSLQKEAEQRFSDLREARAELERVKAKARSEEAQARANLAAKEATYNREKEVLEKLDTMIEKSTIVATRPGVVVYASTSDPRRYRDNPIQEGTSVRQNETILTVPNLSTLAARVNVHETDIARVKPGQPARIKMEAIPDTVVPGQVIKISPMASSEHRWLNPDVMVYETDVGLNETPEGVTIGMSATVEIIVAELKDVLYIPLQAVASIEGQRVCWVRGADGPQIRQIEVGQFTENFAEIKSGLRQGEMVYLAPPAEWREQVTAGRPEPADAQEQPAEDEQQQGEGSEDSSDLSQLRQKMEGMSREERREFIRNLPEEQRDKLMQQFRGRGGPGAGDRPGPDSGRDND